MTDASPPNDPLLAAHLERLQTTNGLLREKAAAFPGPSMKHRPGPRRWSAGEVFAHMELAASLYLDRMEQALEAARESGRAPGPSNPSRSLLGRMLMWFLRPGATMPVKAPAKFKPQKVSRDPLQGILDQHARLSELLKKIDGLDAGRIKFRNPVLPVFRMTFHEGTEVLILHAQHHLKQFDSIERATKA